MKISKNKIYLIIFIVTAFFLMEFFLFDNFTKKADNFFNLLYKKEYSVAYNRYLAKELKDGLPLNKFINYVTYYHLDKVESTFWKKKKLSNGDYAYLLGTLYTDIGHIQIEIKLIKRDDKWKIYELNVLNPEKIKSITSKNF